MKNYNEFDTISIYARKNKAEQIKTCYESFAWKLVNEQENAQYSDTQDLTFERPHKIKNKDDLQLLQVYMEDHLNNLGTLEKNKHSKSLVCGIFFGLISLAFIIVGLSVFAEKVAFNIILGSCLVLVGVVFGAIITFAVYKTYKSENELYISKNKQLNDELAEICSTAKKLSGDK